jgi:hypothetical protein
MPTHFELTEVVANT